MMTPTIPPASILHTWPEKLLVGLLTLGGAALVGQVSMTLSLRDSVARLEVTVAALQRQVDRKESAPQVARHDGGHP